VRLEGIAGRRYDFRVWEQGQSRLISVTFPATGANADGYTNSVLRLTEKQP
jgi:hypothetical protein